MRDHKLLSEFAADVRKTFHIETPIDDMNEVVRKMGGMVVEKWYNRVFESAVIKTSRESFVIRVDGEATDRKYRLAKSIGELFLVCGYIIKPEIWNRMEIGIPKIISKHSDGLDESSLDGLTDLNYFAMTFLMPEDKFKEEVMKNIKEHTCNTDEVARKFGVSVSDASIWGKILGVFECQLPT